LTDQLLLAVDNDLPPTGTKDIELCGDVSVVRSELAGVVSVNMPSRSESGISYARVWHNGVETDHVMLSDLAPTLRAPRPWQGLALNGVIAAALLLVVAIRELVHWCGLFGFREAEHEGSGIVSFSDGRRVDATSAATLRAGPVLVRGALPEAPRASYRERAELATAALVIRDPYELGSERDRRAHRVMFASAAALTIALGSSALLAAAWLFGLPL